jgi:hypothetical protein
MLATRTDPAKLCPPERPCYLVRCLLSVKTHPILRSFTSLIGLIHSSLADPNPGVPVLVPPCEGSALFSTEWFRIQHASGLATVEGLCAQICANKINGSDSDTGALWNDCGWYNEPGGWFFQLPAGPVAVSVRWRRGDITYESTPPKMFHVFGT